MCLYCALNFNICNAYNSHVLIYMHVQCVYVCVSECAAVVLCVHVLYVCHVCVCCMCGVHACMCATAGTYGRMHEGYLANAEDDVEGAVPVMIKTVVGQ